MKRRNFLKGLLATPIVAFIPTVFAKVKSHFWGQNLGSGGSDYDLGVAQINEVHMRAHGEMIVFGKVHGERDMAGVHGYLAKKYNLPYSHIDLAYTEERIEKMKPVSWRKP